jgi:hypothetical protein
VEGTGLKAIEISGWIWDNQHHRPAVAVVATKDGIITGWAAVGGWRPSVRAANPRLTTSYIGFAGYVREEPGSIAVKLYAVLEGTPKSACPLATIEPVGRLNFLLSKPSQRMNQRLSSVSESRIDTSTYAMYQIVSEEEVTRQKPK